jgi:hypothetical protein
MMPATEWHGKLVADFQANRSRLSKAQMMRIGWLPATDQAWLRGDESEMGLVPQALGLAKGELAFVDASLVGPGRRWGKGRSHGGWGSGVGRRQLEADRHKSAGGGPKTAAGKRRSRTNARKHGLSIPVTSDRQLYKAALELARAIAGENASPALLNQAFVVAECELALQRVHQARVVTIEAARTGARVAGGEATSSPPKELIERFVVALPILSAMERYERRACSRQRKALAQYNDLRLIEKLKSQLE